MANCDEKDINDVMSFIFEAPCEEEIVNMDCNDYCTQVARVAEQVACGVSIKELMPKLQQHLKYWVDCREEFDALVTVLKANSDNQLSAEIDAMIADAKVNK